MSGGSNVIQNLQWAVSSYDDQRWNLRRVADGSVVLTSPQLQPYPHKLSATGADKLSDWHYVRLSRNQRHVIGSLEDHSECI